jgi:hypothetical protein
VPPGSVVLCVSPTPFRAGLASLPIAFPVCVLPFFTGAWAP